MASSDISGAEIDTPLIQRSNRRMSMASDSSESTTPERELYDDGDSIMEHANDSQSSLGVSLEDMDLDQSSEYEELCRITPINRLPAELLITIFSKLPSAVDVRNCMLVTKSWARNSVDLLWHRPDSRNWDKLLNIIQTVRKKQSYFAYQDLIKRLNLAALGDLISDGTLRPMSNCKRIERLTLTNCRMLTDWSVAALIKGNRNLLAIDCTNLDQITDVSLLAIANDCYRLQGLNVTKCTKITDESLIAIARNCRRVKRLKFNDCPQLTDRSIVEFADHCHDILEIDCAGCVHLTDMSITALIQHGKQLRELRLQHCHRITDQAFLRLPSEPRYEALRILDLTDCYELQDAGLHRIVEAAPKLRNLVLAKCRQITDVGVRSVTNLGKNLHYIHLGHCSRITDSGVINLITKCNRIRYIDLACCQHLTDASVSMLAMLPKLKRIGLVKCQLITDESLKALAAPRQHSPNMLERLHLSYCTLLTVSGVRRMLVNCPRLTHLSLTGVPEFLEGDYLQFIREAPAEFNDHQREMFCVYSGEGVAQLREYLKLSLPSDESDSESTIVDAMSHTPTHDHPGTVTQLAMHNGMPYYYSAPPTPFHTTNNHHQLSHGAMYLPPPPPHHIMPPHLTGHALAQHVGAANRPPPPPPAHTHMPQHNAMMQLSPGIVAMTDEIEDEDVDEDMRVDEE